MSQFRDRYDEFRRHEVEVAGVSVDSPYAHRAWSTELKIPFPLISDFGRTLMQAYHIPEREMRHLPHVATRSAFVIDSEAIVRLAWYEPPERGLPPVDEILDALRDLPESKGAV